MMGYVIGYSLAALCALVCAVVTYGRKNRMGVITGTMFMAAAAVNLSYLARIDADTYFTASMSTSIYFVCLDILVLTAVCYVVEFTQPKLAVLKHKRQFYLALAVLVLADAACLIFNIFHEISLRYQFHEDSMYAVSYMYEERTAFYFHMGLVCLLAGLAILILIYKTISIPKIYRARYRNCLLWMITVMTLVMMYMTGILRFPVDVAVLVYGFGCPFVYRNTFDYSSKSMLNTTRKMILEYMGTPMILFDYEGYVADSNKDMRDLFPVLNNREHGISMIDFIQIGAFRELQNTSTDQVFEWENPKETGPRVYHCDFSCLRDERGHCIGNLLILKSKEVERDMLTHLYSRNSFYSSLEKAVSSGSYPVTVVVCNTNGIGLVNDVYGWARGNKMLKKAADLLREHLPGEAVLARLEDGDMAAGLIEAEQEYAIRLFENIREQYRQDNDTGINTDLEYGIAVIRDGSKSIEEAVREAGQSMRTKKLMNQSSRKSSLLDSLTQTLTESDYETEEHVERTKEMATRLGRALNLSDVELGKLALLAVLHDIGKIAIPHTILCKPGKLTDAEWEIMKTHTEKGYRIASASKELHPIGEFILHHHERWDGGGYPGGLAKEEIPLLSRIITVVDSHDVMVHDRPYHKAMSHEAAVEELRRCSGAQFDPHLVDVFLEVLEEQKVS